jgi:hypothetical protein
MIIGIDETGNFVHDSDLKFHFFTAVQLDQNKNGIELKRQQFQKWLETIPTDKKNKNGEVKGSDLPRCRGLLVRDPIVSISTNT